MEKGCLLTLKKLNEFPCKEIFASGTFLDSIEDIPLCSPISNKEVIWIAVKGAREQDGLPPDWCIYVSNPHYSETDILEMQMFSMHMEYESQTRTILPIWTPELVKVHGDKISLPYNIKKLVPCTEEVFKLYRY